ACLPTAYLTAYHMLFSSARLVPGDTVLVQGSTGGVATATILLARAAGVRVFATSRDEEKRQVASDLGAAATFAPVRESVRAIFAGGSGCARTARCVP